MDRDIELADLIKYSDNSVYKLVNLVWRRAHQIVEETKNLAGEDKDIKPISTAMREIAEGRVKLQKVKES